MALTIANRYTGSVSFTASDSSKTATITAVTMANTVVRASYSVDSVEPEDQISVELTNTTTLTFERQAATGAATVYYEVIEYSAGMSVQRGNFSWVSNRSGTRGEHDITLTAVTLADSWPELTRRSNTAGSTVGNDDYESGYLSSTTNIKFNQQDTTSEEGQVYFQVMEAADVGVQAALAAISGGGSGTTGSITAVDLADTFVVQSFNCGTGSANNIADNLCRAKLTSTTAWTFDKDATASGQSANGRLHFVESTAWDVQYAEQAFTTTETTKSPTLTSVDTTKCFVVTGGNKRCGGKCNYTGNDNEGPGMFELSLAATALTLTRAIHGSATADVPWYVVEEAGGGATVYSRTIVEAIDVTDVSVQEALLARTTIETAIDLLDILDQFAVRNRGIDENLNLSDTLQRTLLASRNIDENINVTDVITRYVLAYRELQDNINLSDIVERSIIEPGGAILTRALQDEINVIDIIERVFLANRSLQDTVDVTDEIAQQQLVFRIVADALIVSDSVVKSLIRNRGIDDNIDVTDLVIRNVFLNRVILETLSVTDDLTVSIEYAVQALAMIVAGIESEKIKIGIEASTIITGIEDAGVDIDVN